MTFIQVTKHGGGFEKYECTECGNWRDGHKSWAVNIQHAAGCSASSPERIMATIKAEKAVDDAWEKNR